MVIFLRSFGGEDCLFMHFISLKFVKVDSKGSLHWHFFSDSCLSWFAVLFILAQRILGRSLSHLKLAKVLL